MVHRRLAVQLAVHQQRGKPQPAGDAVAVQIAQFVHHGLGHPEAAQIDPAVFQKILQSCPGQQLDQLMIAGKRRAEQYDSRRVRLFGRHHRRQRPQRMTAYDHLLRVYLRQCPGVGHHGSRIFRFGRSGRFFGQTVAFTAADAVMAEAGDAVLFQLFGNGHQRPFMSAAGQAVAQHQTGAMLLLRQMGDAPQGFPSYGQRKRRLHSKHLIRTNV